MATYNERLDAIIRACGGKCNSKLYGEKLNTLAMAIGKIDLMSPQTLTDEEKAQARSNIGALALNQGAENAGKTMKVGADGNIVPVAEPQFQLIEEITLTEEINSIFRTETPSGDDYAFREVYITIEMPSNSGTNRYMSFGINKDTASYSGDGTLSILTEFGVAAAQNANAILFAEIRGGVVDGYTEWTSGQKSNPAPKSRSNHFMIADSITSIDISCYVGDGYIGFPAGTIIKIYGR